MVTFHRAGQRCFELLALIGSPQLSFSKVFPAEQTSNISVLVFASCEIVKSYSSMKLTRNDQFCLYLLEKDNLEKGEGKLDRYLSRSDCQLINTE